MFGATEGSRTCTTDFPNVCSSFCFCSSRLFSRVFFCVDWVLRAPSGPCLIQNLFLFSLQHSSTKNYLSSSESGLSQSPRRWLHPFPCGSSPHSEKVWLKWSIFVVSAPRRLPQEESGHSGEPSTGHSSIGGCLSSVDRDRRLERAKLVDTSVRLVGLRIWNERGARQNECETRCWLTLERVRNSLLESFRSRRFSLVAGLDAKDRSLDPESLALACEPTQPHWKKQCELCSSK